MKKFFLSALGCLLIISAFTSCEKKNGTNDKTKSYFAISVTDIGITNATISVKPTDTTMTYLLGVIPTKEYNEDSITSRYSKAFFDDIIDFYSAFGYEMNYIDLFYMGNYNATRNDFTGETDYTIFALGMDTVSFEMTTPVVTSTFTTGKWVKKGERNLGANDAVFYNYVTDEGWWQFISAMPDGNTDNFYLLSVSPVMAETVTGKYTMDDMDPDFTYLRHYAVNGTDTVETDITFIEGTFNVNETSTGATMDAVTKGSDGYIYNIQIEGMLEAEDDANYAPARRNVAVRRHRTLGLKK